MRGSLRASIISDLANAELREISQQNPYPKWSTLCWLRLHGFPTLEAAFVAPPAAAELPLMVAKLRQATGKQSLLVRSDGGREKRRYYRGGSSFSEDRALREARELLDADRAVVLMEPTNRFTNQVSVALRIHRCGELVMELLGPGFDVSDLSRGGVPPAASLTVSQVDWTSFREPGLSDFRLVRFESDEQVWARRLERLKILATQILPSSGEFKQAGEPRDAVAWLRRHGWTSILDQCRLTVSLRRLRSLYEDAFWIAHRFDRSNWACLAATASLLDDGRFIWWDIVDAARKFGDPR